MLGIYALGKVLLVRQGVPELKRDLPVGRGILVPMRPTSWARYAHNEDGHAD